MPTPSLHPGACPASIRDAVPVAARVPCLGTPVMNRRLFAASFLFAALLAVILTAPLRCARRDGLMPAAGRPVKREGATSSFDEEINGRQVTPFRSAGLFLFSGRPSVCEQRPREQAIRPDWPACGRPDAASFWVFPCVA
jgi:hypothetical protein